MGNNYSSVQDLEERNLSAMSVANWGQKWVYFSFEGSFLFFCPSTQLSRKMWWLRSQLFLINIFSIYVQFQHQLKRFFSRKIVSIFDSLILNIENLHKCLRNLGKIAHIFVKFFLLRICINQLIYLKKVVWWFKHFPFMVSESFKVKKNVNLSKILLRKRFQK